MQTEREGPGILEPRVIRDARGYFLESFRQDDFDRNVRPVKFVQENESMSARGVIRGLHFQRPPFCQSKLVRCVSGRVLDVAVGIRKGAPPHGRPVGGGGKGGDPQGCLF